MIQGHGTILGVLTPAETTKENHMSSWRITLRDLVWPAIAAVVLLLAAIVLAVVVPDMVGLAVVLALGSVTFALLAQR